MAYSSILCKNPENQAISRPNPTPDVDPGATRLDRRRRNDSCPHNYSSHNHLFIGFLRPMNEFLNDLLFFRSGSPDWTGIALGPGKVPNEIFFFPGES
jgi:hypothetical protein